MGISSWGDPALRPHMLYWLVVVMFVMAVPLVAATLVRVYRFAAMGTRAERFFPVEFFTRRTWRFVWVNILIHLQVVVLALLFFAPIGVLLVSIYGDFSFMDHSPLKSSFRSLLQLAMYLPATALMAIRYTLSGPAASMQDRVSFEALSTAGSAYRKELILMVLALWGAPSVFYVAQEILEITEIGPAWIANPWIQIVLSLYTLVSYLVFIGACSLAYKALRDDVERETEAVLSRMAYPEAAATAAQAKAEAVSAAASQAPDATRTSAFENHGASDGKA